MKPLKCDPMRRGRQIHITVVTKTHAQRVVFPQKDPLKSSPLPRETDLKLPLRIRFLEKVKIEPGSDKSPLTPTRGTKTY